MSVDDVEAGVFAQALGHDDAFGGLEVLEDGSHDAGQGQSGAVEGVAELRLLVVAAEAAFESVGLVCLEVGYAADLEPASLSCGVDFEVECDGGGEAHVAAAQAQYVPG